MSELAGYLLAAGVSSSKFQRIAKRAYVHAASADARFRNKRVNQSAVAALTGLSRSQVRALGLSGERKESRAAAPMWRLIQGWTTDPEFVTSSYIPRRLTYKGTRSGFAALAKKYACDVSSKTLLLELQRQGLARIDGSKLQLVTKKTPSRHELQLDTVVESLCSLLGNREKGAGSPIRTINLEVAHDTPSAKGRIVLQRRVTKIVRSFLHEIQVAGNAVALEAPPATPQRGWVTRTRLAIHIQDETESG